MGSGKIDTSTEGAAIIAEALRASEEKYRTLTENIAVGIFRSTPGAKGKFIEVNPAFIKILGYDNKQQLLDIHVSDIYQKKKDRQKWSEKIKRTGLIRNEEQKLHKKDGTPIIVSETTIAVHDQKGKIVYFDGMIEDITTRKKTEDELMIQQTYLAELLNSAPESIVLHDEWDLIVNVNHEFTRMFGYTREEAIGQPINSLLAPETLAEEAAGLSQKVIHGERVACDTRRRCKNGTLIDVSILGAPIFHGKEQIGVYAIYRDITQRKKAEEALLLQKTYYERLFNSAPEAIALHDNDDRIANVNTEFTRLFGYTAEEVIGKPINDILANEALREEAENVSQTVMKGKVVELETKRKHKSGRLIDVSILGAPIIHDGKQIGDYAIYRDITERKKAENEIRLQKTYLERLFNSAPEAVVLHDNEDKILDINAEFTRMFGYSREEAVGRSINELLAPDHLKKEAGTFSATVIHGDRLEAESQRKRKDGRLIDVSIMGAPILHDQQQIGVYAIYRDITERKKVQEVRIRLNEEQRMAREIQLNFLPKTDPKIPGYSLAGKSIPASNVGGDYYDFIWLDDHRLAIILGDVSGNGLAASLVMANLQATIRTLSTVESDPALCLERANRLLFASTDARMFISLFYGILNLKSNILCYANAGQDLPAHFSDGKITLFEERGIALGMIPESVYNSAEIALAKGDRVLIYSDGVCEAMNAEREEFGDAAIKKIVEQDPKGRPRQLIDKILNAVNAHFNSYPQNDDMTLVILRRNESY